MANESPYLAEGETKTIFPIMANNVLQYEAYPDV